MKIVSNCPLCEKKALHVMGEGEAEIQQCINCGYSTTSKFIGEKDTNEQYKQMTEEMKSWSKESNGRIWIPTMMTLPFGMLYPFNDEKNKMMWAFAEMVDIPELDQKNYPVHGQEDKFYTRRYDTDNPEIFGEFLMAMSYVNDIAKKNDFGESTGGQ